MRTPLFFKLWFSFIAIMIVFTFAFSAIAIYKIVTNPDSVAQDIGRFVGEAQKGYTEGKNGPNPEISESANKSEDYSSAAVAGVVGQM